VEETASPRKQPPQACVPVTGRRSAGAPGTAAVGAGCATVPR
jgi:hypothetical protein